MCLSMFEISKSNGSMDVVQKLFGLLKSLTVGTGICFFENGWKKTFFQWINYKYMSEVRLYMEVLISGETD